MRMDGTFPNPDEAKAIPVPFHDGHRRHEVAADECKARIREVASFLQQMHGTSDLRLGWKVEANCAINNANGCCVNTKVGVCASPLNSPKQHTVI
jgi:hypothetical protein